MRGEEKGEEEGWEGRSEEDEMKGDEEAEGISGKKKEVETNQMRRVCDRLLTCKVSYLHHGGDGSGLVVHHKQEDISCLLSLFFYLYQLRKPMLHLRVEVSYSLLLEGGDGRVATPGCGVAGTS